MEEKIPTMKGCLCRDWQRSYKEIFMVFLKADEAGFKYHGTLPKYCPFCASKLIDMPTVKRS